MLLITLITVTYINKNWHYAFIVIILWEEKFILQGKNDNKFG